MAAPIADMFGMAPLLLGWWLLLQKRPLPAAILLALAIVSHKGMWPFPVLLMASHVFTVRTAAFFIAAGVMVLPIAIMSLLGTIYHGSPLWMISSDIHLGIRSTSYLPALDGVLGNTLFGGLTGFAKGAIVPGGRAAGPGGDTTGSASTRCRRNQVVQLGYSTRQFMVHSNLERTGDMGCRAVRPTFGVAPGHALWDHGHPYGENP